MASESLSGMIGENKCSKPAAPRTVNHGCQKDLVGRKALLCCGCSAESKVNTELPAPLPFSMRAPHVSRQANDVPTDRCDLRPSGVSPCLIRPSTSCSLANWPSSLRAGARAPPGSVCSVLFLGQWWMPVVPGHPLKLHQRGGLNRFHFFCRKGDGWV